MKTIRIILGILLFAFCFFMIFRGDYLSKQLINTHKIINGGYVFSTTYEGRGNAGRVFLNFKFECNGEIIYGTTQYLLTEISVSNCQKNIIGHLFPVVFVPNNLTNNDVLITRSDFEKYGYSLPDSLFWVQQFFR